MWNLQQRVDTRSHLAEVEKNIMAKIEDKLLAQLDLQYVLSQPIPLSKAAQRPLWGLPM